MTPTSIYDSWKSVALSCAAMVGLVFSAAPSVAIDIAKPFNKSAVQPVRDKWAVLVGVGQYQDPSIAGLRFADKSAVDLGRTLKDPQVGRFAADHVLVLTSAQANKHAIEDAIVGSGLVKKALPNDLIVLYFSTRRMAGANGETFLCAGDTLASEAETSGLDLKAMLTELRRRVQSKRILCLLDTAPAASKQAVAPGWDGVARAAGVTVLAANDSGEEPFALSEAGSSAFLHYLIEGLKAGSGLLPFAVVSQYTADSVRDHSTKTLGKAQSTILAVAPEDSDMASLKIGVAGKSSAGPKALAIGHSVDDLAMKRPDLVRSKGKPAPVADEQDDDEDEQSSAPVDFGSYMTEMKKSIQKRWQPPKGFENRRVVTVFTIARDGSISQPSVVESSGVPAVDQTALDALQQASPLPPLPLGAPKSVQIRYQFDWKVNRTGSTQ